MPDLNIYKVWEINIKYYVNYVWNNNKKMAFLTVL